MAQEIFYSQRWTFGDESSGFTVSKDPRGNVTLQQQHDGDAIVLNPEAFAALVSVLTTINNDGGAK